MGLFLIFQFKKLHKTRELREIANSFKVSNEKHYFKNSENSNVETF